MCFDTSLQMKLLLRILQENLSGAIRNLSDASRTELAALNFADAEIQKLIASSKPVAEMREVLSHILSRLNEVNSSSLNKAKSELLTNTFKYLRIDLHRLIHATDDELKKTTNDLRRRGYPAEFTGIYEHFKAGSQSPSSSALQKLPTFLKTDVSMRTLGTHADILQIMGRRRANTLPVSSKSGSSSSLETSPVVDEKSAATFRPIVSVNDYIYRLQELARVTKEEVSLWEHSNDLKKLLYTLAPVVISADEHHPRLGTMSVNVDTIDSISPEQVGVNEYLKKGGYAQQNTSRYIPAFQQYFSLEHEIDLEFFYQIDPQILMDVSPKQAQQLQAAATDLQEVYDELHQKLMTQDEKRLIVVDHDGLGIQTGVANLQHNLCCQNSPQLMEFGRNIFIDGISLTSETPRELVLLEILKFTHSITAAEYEAAKQDPQLQKQYMIFMEMHRYFDGDSGQWQHTTQQPWQAFETKQCHDQFAQLAQKYGFTGEVADVEQSYVQFREGVSNMARFMTYGGAANLLAPTNAHIRNHLHLTSGSETFCDGLRLGGGILFSQHSSGEYRLNMANLAVKQFTDMSDADAVPMYFDKFAERMVAVEVGNKNNYDSGPIAVVNLALSLTETADQGLAASKCKVLLRVDPRFIDSQQLMSQQAVAADAAVLVAPVKS